MKKRLILLVVVLFVIEPVIAWGGETHSRFCPENYLIDCNIADSFEFQKNNPYANTIYHVCYDNKEDCMPRLVAKYFLKKYYVEGKTNIDYLGAAAHLFQDASCPAHWYPGFKILGKPTYIFAPKWVKTIESEVNYKLFNQEQSWNIPIRFKGENRDINEDYLNNLKKEISETLSKEPQQSLDEIESQIKSGIIWHYLRAYREFIIILFILLIPILSYSLWKYKKQKKHKP